MLCFFAHHRSASSSSNDILREFARSLGWRHCTVHNADMFDHNLAGFCRSRRPDLLTFSNARLEYLEHLPPFRGVHLIRDPRDVLVSAYFSHRDSHPVSGWPELRAHRQQLQAVDEEEGLLLELDFRAQQFADLAAWRYDDPRILEWRMEQMVTDPESHYRQLLDFWGYAVRSDPGRGERLLALLRPLVNRGVATIERRCATGPVCYWPGAAVSPARLTAALHKHSFRRKAGGRQPGMPGAGHHYRLGIGGSWRRHFTPRVRRRFRERHGDLLQQLGYAEGSDW